MRPAFRLPRLAPLVLSLLALGLTAPFAVAPSHGGELPAVKVPPELAAQWLLQLSPGSGVVPGYVRPNLAHPYSTRSGVVLSPGPVAVAPAAAVAGGQVVSRRIVDRRAVAPRGYAVRRGAAYTGYAPSGHGPTGYAPSGYAPGVGAGYVVQPGYLADPRAAAQPRYAYPARTAYAVPAARAAPAPRQIDPIYLPQDVAYSGGQAPGTIVIDPRSKFLYLVGEHGTARRYGVGVGKPGFGWHGTHPITRKAEWPGWTPPSEMIARERRKGRILPAHMEGGEANPLGARAMYLGSTLYRIHGTNAPWTIGTNVSSGCIRMRNQDVTDLYDRVKVGTRVVVL